jgi:hypothetical protein
MKSLSAAFAGAASATSGSHVAAIQLPAHPLATTGFASATTAGIDPAIMTSRSVFVRNSFANQEISP